MKCALSLVALATAATALPAAYVEENHALLWASFKAEHGKKYAPADEARRAAIFKTNMLKAAALEAKSQTGARFGANKFADLSAEEFKAYHSLVLPSVRLEAAPLVSESARLASRAASKDWRDAGAVTQVKDQGQCGSCWAFSSTGGIEGANFLKNKKLVSASEQELVSCDKVDQGCGGGLMEQAFQWLIDNKGGKIVTEAAYPYVSGGGDTGSCKWKASDAVAATVESYTMVQQDEDSLAATLIASGPVSIAVDATSFQTYQSGILDTCENVALDHGVLAVGVTPEYWIVKNSWGTVWGEAGYIRIKRGSNQCLIANHGVLPKAA